MTCGLIRYNTTCHRKLMKKMVSAIRRYNSLAFLLLVMFSLMWLSYLLNFKENDDDEDEEEDEQDIEEEESGPGDV